MATATQYTDYPTAPVSRVFSWSGIFAGTFLFLAIEATFGVLGIAIFTSAAGPHSANSIGTGVNVGTGIWMVVLSIIAGYFAGKLASTHSGAMTRNSGMYAGLVTFGMCIFTSVLITELAPGNVGVRTSVTHESSAGDYWLFLALILSMIAAAAGGVHGSMTGGFKAAPDRITDAKRVA
jgi:hypothetical protein